MARREPMLVTGIMAFRILMGRVSHRYNGIPYFNGKISLGILDSVAGLMGRHTDGCCGGPVTDTVGKPYDIGSRIIMICKASSGFFYFGLVHARGIPFWPPGFPKGPDEKAGRNISEM